MILMRLLKAVPDSVYEYEDKPGEGAKKRKRLKKKDDKFAAVMGEFKRGTLRSGSGGLVTDREQALAIAASEAGISRKKTRKSLENYAAFLKAIEGENSRGLYKGKELPLGTVRDWNNVKYVKTSQGWKPKSKVGMSGILYRVSEQINGEKPKVSSKVQSMQFDIRVRDSNAKVEKMGGDVDSVSPKQAKKLIEKRKAYFDDSGIFRRAVEHGRSLVAVPAMIKSKEVVVMEIPQEFMKSVSGEEKFWILNKGKSLPVGTIRDWKGKKYVKTGQGWKRHKGDGGSGSTKDEGKGDVKSSIPNSKPLKHGSIPGMSFDRELVYAKEKSNSGRDIYVIHDVKSGMAIASGLDLKSAREKLGQGLSKMKINSNEAMDKLIQERKTQKEAMDKERSEAEKKAKDTQVKKESEQKAAQEKKGKEKTDRQAAEKKAQERREGTPSEKYDQVKFDIESAKEILKDLDLTLDKDGKLLDESGTEVTVKELTDVYLGGDVEDDPDYPKIMRGIESQKNLAKLKDEAMSAEGQGKLFGDEESGKAAKSLDMYDGIDGFMGSVNGFVKSIDREERYWILNKGKSLPVGTIRDWKGKKYVKTGQGWKRHKGDGGSGTEI